jgi:hypothetical protein
MIMYQGTRFKPMWKPDAWGSSKAADRKTKWKEKWKGKWKNIGSAIMNYYLLSKISLK